MRRRRVDLDLVLVHLLHDGLRLPRTTPRAPAGRTRAGPTCQRRSLLARQGVRYTVGMIAEGTPAPDFTLVDQFGLRFHLADHRGAHQVLLLFYPLDWTPT